VSSTRRAAFTTTHRVVNWVHHNTSVVWSSSQPTLSTSFTNRMRVVFYVADLTYGRPTIEVQLANFAGWQSELTPIAFFCENLSTHTG
jgi:hypothetical protein